MTGYGSAQEQTDAGRIAVTLRTVNHKNVEVRLRADEALAEDEGEFTATLKGALSRGRVEATIKIERDEDGGQGERFAHVLGDLTALRAQLARTPGITDEASVGELLLAARLGGQSRVRPEATPQLKRAAHTALKKAIDACLAFRHAEGARLNTALRGHCARCTSLIDEIAARAAVAPAEKKAAWQARIAALGAENVDAGRLAQELAILAERLDIAEEVTRLNAHIAHFGDLCGQPTAGRKLGFLCQELLREANTVGSKCQDASTAHLVVELKAEIEKLREQVANIV